MAGSTGVHDTVVNQLLSKIDGVEQLNNILVIGMIMLSFLLWGQVEKCCFARCRSANLPLLVLDLFGLI